MPLLVFGLMFFVPPFAGAWMLLRVVNVLVNAPVRGLKQRHTDSQEKQLWRHTAGVESVEICPHGAGC